MDISREAMDLYAMLSILSIPDSGLSYENYRITEREHMYIIYEYNLPAKEFTQSNLMSVIIIWNTKYTSTSTISENRENIVQRFKNIISPYIESLLYFQ